MSKTFLANARILADGEWLEDYVVVIDGPMIIEILPSNGVSKNLPMTDLSGRTLLPGFIDTQVNGGGGILFNAVPTVEGLRAIASAHRRFGTTGFLATVISDSLDVVAAAMHAVDQAMSTQLPGLLGIHVEGPFLDPGKRGIHAIDRLRAFDDAALALLTRRQAGVVMVTLAPDHVRPSDIARLSDAGVIVSIGHSDATYDQTRSALDAGARGFTHLFNAMSPLTSRAPGVVGAALEDKDSWCGIIVDGYHVHPASLRVALAARPLERFMLVTDAMPPVGTTDKQFLLQGRTIFADANSCFDEKGTLAGAMLDMNQARLNAMTMLGLSLAQASLIASGAPAAFLGEGTRGAIRAGNIADLVAIDVHGCVCETWISGELYNIPAAHSRQNTVFPVS